MAPLHRMRFDGSRDIFHAMPITPQWNAESKYWRLNVGETFDLSDIAQLVNEIDWRECKSFLWDLRELKKGPDSSNELRQAVDMTDQTHEIWAGSRVAILVTRDLDFGLARMFGAFAEEIDVEYRAFRDESAAVDWLEKSSGDPRQ